MPLRRLHALAPSLALLAAAAVASCISPQRPDGGKGLLPEGARAPLLSGTDQSGAVQSIAGERGHALVVYFYPKDGTPGCTAEACAFRETWQRFEAAHVSVFGVSADDPSSHATFAREHRLTFPLISDPAHVWSKAFGVSTTLGYDARVTFLVGPDGRVAKVYPNVDPGVHADAVLRDAAALSAASPSASETSPSAPRLLTRAAPSVGLRHRGCTPPPGRSAAGARHGAPRPVR